MSVTLRKLKSLERLTVLPANILLHVYDPVTGKDYYALAGDLLSGLGYPNWNSVSALNGDYDIGFRVTHGFRLWESLIDNNQVVPNEGASWTEVSPTANTNNVVRHMGNYDASSNLFPATGGSGAGGAIQKGNEFDITVAGTLGTDDVPAGATIRAKVDAPGQTPANWRIYY